MTEKEIPVHSLQNAGSPEKFIFQRCATLQLDRSNPGEIDDTRILQGGSARRTSLDEALYIVVAQELGAAFGEPLRT